MDFVGYTDASYNNVALEGGWAYAIRDSNRKVVMEGSGWAGKSTPSQLELLAIYEAAKAMPYEGECEIVTDSKESYQYAIGLMTPHTGNRIQKALRDVATAKGIRFRWAPRSTSKGNRRAHQLARLAMDRGYFRMTTHISWRNIPIGIKLG